MSLILKRYEKMTYHPGTIYDSSFNRHPIPPETKETLPPKKRLPALSPHRKEEQRTVLPKDCESLIEYKKHIDFTLMWKPKEIIRTRPTDIQMPYIEDKAEKELARRTRPRLVMTPAVSLDDFEDPDLREHLINNIYLSTTMQAAQEVQAPNPNLIKAPLPDYYAPAKPIYLPKLKPNLVSEEWRMDSVQWDRRQLRGHCETEKEFWKRINTSSCKACEQSAQVKKLRERRLL